MSTEYPCIYFEKDGRCRKFSDDTVTSYCVMGPCPEQKISNAERIRAMSDEELAEFLAEEQFRIANTVFQTVGYGLKNRQYMREGLTGSSSQRRRTPDEMRELHQI